MYGHSSVIKKNGYEHAVETGVAWVDRVCHSRDLRRRVLVAQRGLEIAYSLMIRNDKII